VEGRPHSMCQAGARDIRFYGLRPGERFGTEVEFFHPSFLKGGQRLLELPALLLADFRKDVLYALFLHGLLEGILTFGGQSDSYEVLALHVLGPLEEALFFHAHQDAGYGMRFAQEHARDLGRRDVLAHGLDQEEDGRGSGRQVLGQKLPFPDFDENVCDLQELC